VYHAGELTISTQVFGEGHLGVWAQEVSRKIGSNVVSPEKVTKIKKYFICCDIIMKIKGKRIFYLL